MLNGYRHCLRLASATGLALALAACGQLDLKKNLEAAVRKQDGVDSKVLELWARSPVIDGGDLNLDASMSLDSVPRTELALTGLADAAGLPENDFIAVSESGANSGEDDRPRLIEWAGTLIPWANPAFQVFMAFYHGNLAAEYAFSLIDSFDPGVVTVFAAEPGDPFGTHYSPSAKTITFYRQDSGAPYNPADEADAIYHEYGHVVQHQLAEDAIEDPTQINYHFDALQEGLSDFAAAAVARDDRTNGYLASNTRLLSTASEIFDPATYTRSVRNDFFFPNAWVGGLLSCHESDPDCGGNHNIHQDGRVVSGALNDIRKYLGGYAVTEQNCEGDACVLQIETPLGEYEAWDETYVLAHEAFRSMSDTRTLFYFAKRMLAICTAPAFTWCSADVKADLQRLLIGRGLFATTGSATEGPYKWGEFTDSSITVSAAAGAHLLTSATVGWLPLSGSGYGNTNSTVGTCEAMFIFPNFENVSHLMPAGGQARIAGMSVEITSISGFRNVTNPSSGAPVEQVTSSSGREEKFLGWLDPDEETSDFVKDSGSSWYQNFGGSSLSAYPTLSSAYSEMGWFVRAPTSSGTTASVTFEVTLRVFNRATYEPLTFTVTQTLTPSSSESFCE